MRKISILVSYLIVLTLLFASCKGAVPGEEADGSTPPVGPEGSKVDLLNDKSKWAAVTNIDTCYVKLDDINPKDVPEIKIGPVIDKFRYMVKEDGDGLLCGFIPSPEQPDASEAAMSIPEIRKLDINGKVVWVKRYDYQTYSGGINNIVTFPDGSFLFSVQTYPYSREGRMIYEKSFIIKCDKEGNELWKRDFEDYSGRLLNSIFLTGKGDIVAVGEWHCSGSMQTMDGADDIVITKLDKDGNVLQQKSFGGSDFDSLYASVYEDGLGIVINGRTQSHNGDFGIADGRDSTSFAACIDEDLILRWVIHGEQKENFIDQLAADDGFVYIPGSFINTAESVSKGFLLKLDKDGKRVWTKEYLSSGMWARTLSILQNKDAVLGWGGQNQGIIAIFDGDGNEKKRLEDLKFAPGQIVPTDDGGFTVTASREIKAVPQPLYISSIWYDTEHVAVKYSSDYKVEWRKTYDKVKDEMGSDFVLPLENGSIVVE